MWCDTNPDNLKDRLYDYINYFEGTCEFCIDNVGISQYLADIDKILEDESSLDDECKMLAHYIHGVITYKMNKLDEAYKSWMIADRLALITENNAFRAKIESYISIYYYVNNDAKLSQTMFDEAASLLENEGNYTELALHYINMLWYKRYDPDKEQVADYLDKAFYYVQQSHDIKDARVYLHLGYIYKNIFNDFIRGLKYLTTARDMCYKNGNVEMESMTLHVLADGYMHLFHYEEAMDIYNQLLNDQRYKDITASLKCMILTNVTTCFIAMNDYREAAEAIGKMRDNIKDSLFSIKEQFETVYTWLTAKLHIARYDRLGQAETLLNICRNTYDKHKDDFILEEFDYMLQDTLTDYYVALGERDNAFDSAIDLVKVAEKYGTPALQNAYSKLSMIYEVKGDYKEALKYRKMESAALDKVEESNLITQYDKLFKEFLRYTQAERLNDLKEEQLNLSKAAYIDELTQVYNKSFYQNMVDMWNDGIREEISCIMVDIDFFKQYNDLYGHQAGDNVLEQVAFSIKMGTSETNSDVIRFGGEEFLIILREPDPNVTKELAEALVKGVELLRIPHADSAVSSYITVSAGFYSDEKSLFRSLGYMVEMADKSLYKAKNNGRNRAEG